MVSKYCLVDAYSLSYSRWFRVLLPSQSYKSVTQTESITATIGFVTILHRHTYLLIKIVFVDMNDIRDVYFVRVCKSNVM